MPAFTPSISVAGSLSPTVAAVALPIGSWIKSVDSPVSKPVAMTTGKAASTCGTVASWVVWSRRFRDQICGLDHFQLVKAMKGKH
ncbi:hypothetical protein P5673_028443 [Acropora cervicornis]|uniref:Uncharacterized protein n=1 Tax=Acropora cervicornis TaxID=6130 RepID=A0AAD9PXB8_ACRCE|nr:hypothetical protein P5673_028443 [Acropora cervicornis]